MVYWFINKANFYTAPIKIKNAVHVDALNEFSSFPFKYFFSFRLALIREQL